MFRRRQRPEESAVARCDGAHVLRTARLELRPASPGSSDLFLQTIDREVRQEGGLPPGCPAWFFVWESSSAALIGQYVIDFTNRLHGMPTLGWWLGGQGRGRGYGRESLPAVIGYVHEHLGLRAVAMGTTETNARAIRQIESVGARYASSGAHRLPDGSMADARWSVNR